MVMHWPVSVPMSTTTVPSCWPTRSHTGRGSSSLASPISTVMQSERLEPEATCPVCRCSEAASRARRLFSDWEASGTAICGPIFGDGVGAAVGGADQPVGVFGHRHELLRLAGALARPAGGSSGGRGVPSEKDSSL